VQDEEGGGRRKMNLKTTGEYPCQWDDIVNERGKTYATIYTLKNAREDEITKAGITKKKDGIFDMVVDAPELTKELVQTALKKLSKITGIEYKFSN